MILLSSAWSNLWTLLFFPTILMVCTLPLWFIKKLHNSLIKGIVNFVLFGMIVGVFIISATDKSINSPGIMGGLCLSLGLMVLNGWPYILYTRYLNNCRCPNCHNVGLKRISKDVDTYTNTSTTIYKVHGGQYDGKEYQRNVNNIYKYTTYTNYCPACNSVIVWTEESEDKLVGDNRPEEVRNMKNY